MYARLYAGSADFKEQSLAASKTLSFSRCREFDVSPLLAGIGMSRLRRISARRSSRTQVRLPSFCRRERVHERVCGVCAMEFISTAGYQLLFRIGQTCASCASWALLTERNFVVPRFITSMLRNYGDEEDTERIETARQHLASSVAPHKNQET